MKCRSAQSQAVREALKDTSSRITTIAQVNDHLWRSARIGYVDIADFAGELCRKLQETVPHTGSLALATSGAIDTAWRPGPDRQHRLNIEIPSDDLLSGLVGPNSPHSSAMLEQYPCYCPSQQMSRELLHTGRS